VGKKKGPGGGITGLPCILDRIFLRKSSYHGGERRERGRTREESRGFQSLSRRSLRSEGTTRFCPLLTKEVQLGRFARRGKLAQSPPKLNRPGVGVVGGVTGGI